MSNNKLNIEFTDEERERYDYLKEVSIKLYPQIANDSVMGNLSEYLYIYYAKNGVLPGPVKKDEKEQTTEPKIIEYKTPSDAGSNLIRPKAVGEEEDV